MRPPRIAEALVHWLCDDGQHADIPSDLEDEFDYNLSRKGPLKARIKYSWTAVRLIRPFIIKDKFLRESKIANSAIIRSSLTTFRRNALSGKTNFIISFLGLSIGLTCFLLILNYVTHEIGYDRFHDKSDNIYRVTYAKKQDGVETFHSALPYAGIGRPLTESFDEIVDYVRVRPINVTNDKCRIRTATEVFEETKVYLVDQSFFKIFSFELLKGSPTTCLREPYTAVISSSTAKKYFGDSDPMGQVLSLGENEQFTITGVIQDAPENSHIKYHVLISHTTLRDQHFERSENNMSTFHGQLFIETKPGTDIQQIVTRFPKFVDDFVWTWQTRSDGLELELYAMPMTDIHLKSTALHEMEVTGNIKTIRLLSWTASLILILAWANHIGLITARSAQRLKESGIRIVLGSNKNIAIKQAMIESAIVIFMSLLIALGLVYLTNPLLIKQGIYEQPLPNPSKNELFWMSLIGLFFISSLITGLISAISIHRTAPLLKLRLLSNYQDRKPGYSKFRKGLVVFQFTICVILLSGTIVGYRQLSYLRNAELGISIDNSLVVEMSRVTDSISALQTQNYKEALLQKSFVRNITFSTDLPGREITRSTWYRKLDDLNAKSQYAYNSYVDENFIPSFNIEVLAGKNFALGDSLYQFIINETFMESLGIKDPEDAIGQVLIYHAQDGTTGRRLVTGVVKNYHQLSAKNKPVPQILIFYPFHTENFIVKMSDDLNTTNQMIQTIAEIEKIYNEHFPNRKFEASFLDYEFEKLYETDKRLRNTFTIFSILAIVVTSLGLLGLSLHNVIQRAKEMSIRKILGSTTTQITGYFLSDYIKLIVIANAIAWPLSYYSLNFWLKSTFENHISVEWWLFPAVLFFVCLISIITVSANTFKAAKMNPVHFLKSE